MFICAAGDIHGEIEQLYSCVESLEREAGQRVDLVLQVGDFGVWPDAERLDEATRRHGDSGEFRKLHQRGARVPRPTAFIAGNHEDFEFLHHARPRQLVPDLWFLPWGSVMEFRGGDGQSLRIGAVGGCYGERDYGRERLVGAARRHYCKRDLEQLAQAAGELDVLLLHEPPAGTITELHAPQGFRRRTWNLRGEGQSELVARVRPRVCFTGHIHARTERRIDGVRVVGLNKVPHRGSVVLLEVPAGRSEVRDLVEWGGAPEERGGAVVREEAPPLAEDVYLEELVGALRAWAAGVTGGATLSRAERIAMHRALEGEPMRAALMSALVGGDPTGVLARELAPAEREAVLRAWESGGLPAMGRSG